MINNSRFFLFLPLLICIALASGLHRLQENSDGRVFFDPDSRERQQLLALEQQFTQSNSLLMVLSAKSGDIFEANALNTILDLTRDAWVLPYITRVNSLSNYQRITSRDDEVIIEDMYGEDILEDAGAIAQMQVYALSEQDIIRQILSEDGTTTALLLNFAAPRGDSTALDEIMGEVENIREKLAKNQPDLTFHITGDIPLDNAFAAAYADDLQNLFPLFLLVIFLICLMLFRSPILSALILSLMLMVVLATMGSGGYLGINLTAGTSAVPLILITISLADFIHILWTAGRIMRAGQDKMQAIEQSLHHNFLPVSLTSFTTLVGFLSLNFSDAPPFRDMGNLVAIGIIVSYMLTFSLFPILLGKLKLERIFQPADRAAKSEFIPRYARFLVRKGRSVMAIVILLSLIMGAGLAHIEFDDDWVKYFDEDNIFRQDTEYVQTHLTGVDSIEYVISSDEAGGVSSANFLKKLDRFEKWALAQPEIIHISSILSLFKKMNFHMNGKSAEYGQLADNSDLNAQYLLLYEMSLPVGLDLNDRIDIAKQATRLTLTAHDMTSRQMRNLDRRVSEKLQEMHLIAPGAGGTGIPLMFAHLSKRNIMSMLMGIGFALVVVSLVIIVVFRSLRLGLISFLVNILPIILGFGLWGWVFQYVGVSLTVVAAIAFGIVVDDSIHFISKYIKANKRNEGDPAQILTRSFSDVGGALVMTTMILVTGFLLLTYSAFQPTWGLGLICAVMISMALALDFLLLPVLLLKYAGKKI